MTYCYFGLECSLQSLLLIPGLALACEQWRSRCITEGVMEDVYDGNIWKEFQVYGDRPFLSNPFAFGLMMNIDWFQPYRHLTYSVGVMYLTIMNLRRSLRYKRENILLDPVEKRFVFKSISPTLPTKRFRHLEEPRWAL